jgi:hypothetical protein
MRGARLTNVHVEDTDRRGWRAWGQRTSRPEPITRAHPTANGFAQRGDDRPVVH